MAGECQFQTAAKTEAMDAGDDRERQALQSIEVPVDLTNAVDHLALVGELLKLAHVSADDEALLLAGDEHQSTDRFVAHALLGALDDHGKLF